ncbi:hypothetical protein BRC83_01000 [Halobacteriales archaeon QS_1_68_17]|nr:MAG: hypothetical protein BRC83_01000 [Halobacteriales archaeon QS_1_68_17]
MYAARDAGDEDRELLGRTGQGGVFSKGWVSEQPLAAYLGGGETARFVVANRRAGVERRGDAGVDRYRPGSGYRAFAVLTARRVLFVVGDGADSGDWSASIPYAELGAVDLRSGVFRQAFQFSTTSGVIWRFPVRDSDDLDRAAAYAKRAAGTWARVESRLNEASRAVVAVADYLDRGAHDRATAALERADESIDDARGALASFDDGIAPLARRVGNAEQRLRRARLDERVSRARRRIEAGESRWRDQAYDAAYGAFADAHDLYLAAVRIASDLPGNPEPGVGDLLAGLDRVQRKLGQLRRAPFRRARQLHERAEATADPELAADRWDETLEAYRTALVLDWGRDAKRFAGDRETVVTGVERAVEAIGRTRRTLADRATEAGDRHAAAGREERAREQYAAAADHLRRALAVAREYRPDRTGDLERRLAAVEAELDRHDRPAEDAEDESPGPVAGDG